MEVIRYREIERERERDTERERGRNRERVRKRERERERERKKEKEKERGNRSEIAIFHHNVCWYRCKEDFKRNVQNEFRWMNQVKKNNEGPGSTNKQKCLVLLTLWWFEIFK